MDPSFAPTPRPSASTGCFRTGWLGVLSNVLLFLLVFGLSASVETQAVRQKITDKYHGLLMGLGSQFVVLPFIGCASRFFPNCFSPCPSPLSSIARRAVSLLPPLLPRNRYATVKMFDLPPVTGITLLVVTSSPGGQYSNLWCSLFNADLGLSIAMTSASSLAAMVFLPLNILIYVRLGLGAQVHISWPTLFATVAVILAAVAAGMFITRTA